MVTIDEAINILNRAKTIIGGDRPLILSLTDAELPDTEIDEIVMLNYADSHYVEVRAYHSDIVIKDLWGKP